MTSLSQDLAALASMSPVQLRAEWRRVHRANPPPFTAELLLRGIAYRLQERVYGKVSAKTLRSIRQQAAQAAQATETHGSVQVKPGTRLVRHWKGKTYSVLVTDEGFLLGDTYFPSLSQAAEAITGAHWSGPRFFGVKANVTTTGAAAVSAARRQNAQRTGVASGNAH